MVLLKDLGSYGNEASLQKIGWAMGISKGAVNECVMRACSAILKLQKEFIRWPGKRKGKLLVQGLARHMVVNCVGLIDRMLFPLGFAHSKWGRLFHK